MPVEKSKDLKTIRAPTQSMPVRNAAIASSGLGLIFAFVAHFKFTFQKTGKWLARLTGYVALALFNASVVVAGVVWLNELLGWELAKVASNAVIVFWNFLIYRYLLFRSVNPTSN